MNCEVCGEGPQSNEDMEFVSGTWLCEKCRGNLVPFDEHCYHFYSPEDLQKMRIDFVAGYNENKEALVTFARGAILHGEPLFVVTFGIPGVGKSFMASYLGKKLAKYGYHLLVVHTDQLMQYGEATIEQEVSKVKELIAEETAKRTKMVIYLDEGHGLAPRVDGINANRTLWLMYLVSGSKCLVVLATNFPEKLNFGLVGKLPRFLYFRPPNVSELREKLEHMNFPWPDKCARHVYSRSKANHRILTMRSIDNAAKELRLIYEDDLNTMDEFELAEKLYDHTQGIPEEDVVEYEQALQPYLEDSRKALASAQDMKRRLKEGPHRRYGNPGLKEGPHPW